MKGLLPVNKKLRNLAAVLMIGAASVAATAQQAAGTSQQTASTKPQGPVIAENARAESLPNIDALKKELKRYHECTCTCGCYARDLDRQADRAIAFLRRRAAHPRPREKLAMVFDIDETALTNWQELVGGDFAYNKAAFDAWNETGQAPAIPGSVRIDKEAKRLGVAVFFITGRPERERAITEQNLKAQGFDGWQELALRSPEMEGKSAEVYKSSVRAGIVAEGYRIVLNVGDQWSDLKGKPEAEFSVKYPNPYYFIP
jgi:acid phosphatase